MVRLPVAGSDQTYNVQPTKIVALGLNYRDHIAESQSVAAGAAPQEEPSEPVLFPKTPNCLIAHGDPIVIPRFLSDYRFENPRIDYEAELAFVIDRECKNVSEANAMEVIYGFMCLNDVSQRNLQMGDTSGWFRGKSLDTFGPIGPNIVLTRDIRDPQNLDIACRLNGKTVQSSNTRHMIFPIRQIVSFITRNFTMMPGDIVTTGTPSGVGPISPGDTVEVEIEGIGVLRNPVEAES